MTTLTASAVNLEEEAQPETPLISITVSAFDGRTMTAELPPDNKVQVLNEQVATFLGTRSEQVKLFFQGKVLDETRCFVDYGLCNDAFLNALVVLPTAVSAAMKELSHHDAYVRVRGLRALTDLGSIAELAIETVEQLLGDKNHHVAVHAALTLGRIGAAASSATQALLKLVEIGISSRLTDEDFGKDDEFEQLRNSRFDEDFHFIIESVVDRFKNWKTLKSTDLALVGIYSLGRVGCVTMPLLLRAWLDKDAAAIKATLAQARENAQKHSLDIEVMLRDKNRLVHMSAAKVFITRLGKHAVPILEQLLGHTFVGVRHLAAKSLLSETEAFSSLLRVLRCGNSAARVMAVALLGQLGEQARPTLEGLTTSVDADLQSAAIQALGDMGDEAAIPALLRVFLGRDYLGRDYRACVAATTALGKLGEAGMAVLEMALSVDYWAVQEELLTVLEASGEMAVPLLTRMLSAPSRPGCVRAIEILGRLGAAAAPAATTLAGLLAEGNLKILRRKAVAALQLLGSGAVEAVPVLEELLGGLDSNDSIYGEIGKVLVNCGEAGIPAILRCLYSEDVRTQRLAVCALGLMGGAAVPNLTAMLEQPRLSPEIQQDIAAALGGAGRLAVSAVLPLCRLLQDEQVWVRFEAATAIERIASSCDGMFPPGVTQAIVALQDAMGDCDAWVRVAVTNALAAFGSLTMGATQRLSQALAHPDMELQKASRRALKRIAPSSPNCSNVTRRVARRLMATADRT